jgi:hypothetical protein
VAGVIHVQIPVRYRVTRCRCEGAPPAIWHVFRGGHLLALAPTLPDAYAVVRDDLDRRTK